MKKFVIAPHMRLQEWVAVEKGYFDSEGLDYILEDQLKSITGKVHDLGNKVGAYQTFESGRSCDVSSACHWTVMSLLPLGMENSTLMPIRFHLVVYLCQVTPQSSIQKICQMFQFR